MERRSQGFYSQNSDEEEDEESYQARRRGASMDDFLRGSELGRQVWQFNRLPYQTLNGNNRPFAVLIGNVVLA